MAVSFIQRFVEDAFNVGLNATGNFTKGVTRSHLKGKGWANRGQDIVNSLNPRGGMAHGAYDDMVDQWRRAKGTGGWGYAKAAINMPFHAVHMGMGAVGDVAKAGLGTAATIAGTGVGAVGKAGGLLAAGAIKYGALKPGWALTKAFGPGIAKGTAAGAYVVGRDLTIGAAATGKFLWKTRKDPLVGSALVGGAIVAGAALGNGEFKDRQYLGTPDGGKYGSRKGFGYMNTEITGGAWQLNNTGPSSPQIAELQNRMNEQGGFEGVMTTKGPFGDDSGATGDLVFALNKLRSGGLF